MTAKIIAVWEPVLQGIRLRQSLLADTWPRLHWHGKVPVKGNDLAVKALVFALVGDLFLQTLQALAYPNRFLLMML